MKCIAPVGKERVPCKNKGIYPIYDIDTGEYGYICYVHNKWLATKHPETHPYLSVAKESEI